MNEFQELQTLLTPHKIDVKQYAESWGYTYEEALNLCIDGRVSGISVEPIVATKVKGKKAENNNLPYDVVWNDKKLEVRRVTKNVSFAASKQNGYGRRNTAEGFAQKQESLDCYVIVDFNVEDTSFYFYVITKNDVQTLVGQKKTKQATRRKFFKYLPKREVINGTNA